MSSKGINEASLESQIEETEYLLYACKADTKDFASVDEMKNFDKDAQLGEDLEMLKIKDVTMVEREKAVECRDDVAVLVAESFQTSGRAKTTEPANNAQVFGMHESPWKEEGSIKSTYEEPEEDLNGVTFERLASLAEPEKIENYDDDDIPVNKKEQEVLLLYESFEKDACQTCFKILEENAKKLTKFGYSGKMGNLCLKETNSFDETVSSKKSSCKIAQHIADLDSSGSFRASVPSLSTCHDSVPSSRGCPNKNDLFLDLECRICHDHEGQDLISPCHCAGTSKWVHESCIIKWLRHTKTKQCEICTGAITVKRKKKPIDQWTRPSASCGPCNKVDIWYCVVLALCILIIIGFVVLQSQYDVTDQIETTVIFASIYILCGMIIMMKARYFWSWFVHRSSFWGNWKNLNEEWRVVGEANEANIQTPVSPV